MFHFSSRCFLHLLLLLAAGTAGAQSHSSGPVHVFLLAGQSNMQGHGFITEQVSGVEVQGTLRHFVDNNPEYGFLRTGGSWVVRDDAWTWVRQGPVGTPNSDTYSTGNLTAGFGAGTNGGPTSWAIGPEFGFGMKVGDAVPEQIVLVKMAWGGSSLTGDWRPPSAVAKRGGVVGPYYNLFLSTWQTAQAAITARYPGRPIAIKGFGWHQGENDRFSDAATSEYEANLADLIVDLRAALAAPGMAVVISTTSDGPVPTEPYDAGETRWLAIESAQLAMSSRENVSTVSTRPFYRVPAVSPRNEDIHWNKNAESVYKMGGAMGDAMVVLLTTPDVPDTTPPTPDPLGFATPPTALNSGSVTMTANTATDTNGVQYRFVETSGNPGATSSPWQYSPTYTDTGLAPGTIYRYTVQARDLSAANNTTASQAAVAAGTPAADTTAPAPDPMAFTAAPAAANAITVNMTAATAVDANYPVDYFFEETTGNAGGTDSGWQSSPIFSDTGLKPSTTYSYRVKARDREAIPNETAWSAVFSATTPAVPAGTIVWSTPSDIGGPADVSTNGTLVASHTGHNGGGNVTVNGVIFAQGRIPGANNSGGDIGTRVSSTGNTAYDTLLRSISWNYTGGKVTFTGLTSGATYEVQLWAADNVNTPAGMTSIVLSHGTVYAVNLVHEPLSGAPGQFTTGTFTANGTNQEFNLAAYNDYATPGQTAGGAAITNGLQLRLLSGGTADTSPPTPNPSSWATPPASSGPGSIAMTSTTASDANGVEYYFDETTGNPGGNDSGWQDGPAYTDTGLSAATTYTYTVRTRDKSPARNATVSSPPASAATGTSPQQTTVWNVNVGTQITASDNFQGAAAENPASGSFWNGFSSPPVNMALRDSANGATSVTLDLAAVNLATSAAGAVQTRIPTTGDEIFHSYMGGTSVQNTITLRGLTPGIYDLIVYSDWFWGASGNSYPIQQTIGTGLSGTAYLNRPDRTGVGIIPALEEDTSPLNDFATEQGNWIRLSGLVPDSNGHLQFRLGGLNVNQGLSGFQLIGLGGTAPDDYDLWAAAYSPADLSDPAGDFDRDGLVNDRERAFGLDPTSGASVNPITIPLDRASGTFSYTRRNPALTLLSYSIWTSTTLNSWTRQTAAIQAPGPINANGVQTVAVTLVPTLLSNPALFVRVTAEAPAN